jgi:O-antigen ligase
MVIARPDRTRTSSSKSNPLHISYGASARRRMPRLIWWCSTILCGLLLLNVDGILEMAGFRGFLVFPMLGLCAVIILGSRDEVHHLKRSPASWTYLFVLGFLSIAMLSAVTSRYGNLDKALQRAGLPSYIASLLVLTSGIIIATRAVATGRFDALLKLFFWLCTAAAMSGYVLPVIPGIADYVTSVELSSESGRRAGAFGNVNELGLQSGYPIILGLVLSLRSRNVFWLVLGVSAGAMGVLASFSKSAMVMFVLLMMLVFWEGWKARSKSTTLGLTIGLMGLGAVLVAAYLVSAISQGTATFDLTPRQESRIRELYLLLTTGVLNDVTTTGRAGIWEQAINIWRSSPIIGCGLTTFGIVPGTEANAHNSVLVVLGESGVLGLSLFGAMLLAWLTSLWRCGQRDVRILGVGFLLTQFPLWMSGGQAMRRFSQYLITGCVLGLLVMALPPTSRQQKDGPLTTGG